MRGNLVCVLLLAYHWLFVLYDVIFIDTFHLGLYIHCSCFLQCVGTWIKISIWCIKQAQILIFSLQIPTSLWTAHNPTPPTHYLFFNPPHIILQRKAKLLDIIFLISSNTLSIEKFRCIIIAYKIELEIFIFWHD